MIKSNNSIKRLCITYLISLIPLIIFGFYKNGISLYIKEYIDLLEMFKPLLFILIGAIIGIVVNIIYNIITHNKDTIKESIFNNFYMIYGILIGCISSINTNLLLFTSITFIVLLISKFIKYNKFNVVALTSLIIFFIMNILNKFSFLNIYESSNNFNMNAIDYLFGKGSGGIFTTNIILLGISFIILFYNKIYKRIIPIFSTAVFIILSIIYSILINNISGIFDILFTNGILFNFIYLASDSISSSYTKKGQIIYGILVGILTFGLYLLEPALSSLGAIFIASILSSVIDLKFE